VEDGGCVREGEWTHSIAIGGEAFVEKTKHGMKESYSEGVASHTGRESCGGGSNAMAEVRMRRNRGTRRRAIELRNQQVPGADLVVGWGRQSRFQRDAGTGKS
jgi:hypothetical protein